MSDQVSAKAAIVLNQPNLVWRRTNYGKLYPTLYYEIVPFEEQSRIVAKCPIDQVYIDRNLSLDEIVRLYPAPLEKKDV